MGKVVGALFACLLGACVAGTEREAALVLPELPAPRARADNPLTAEKVELGRHLFYDVRLSLHENVACASCHRQELAFSDGRVLSEGTTGQKTHRNASSLVNSGYAATLTFANFVLTDFERQALVPLFGEDPVEMGMAGRDQLLLARLAAEPRYGALFQRAFPGDPAPLQVQNLVRALASFQQSLVSARSAYDRFVAGDDGALSASALRGLVLFESERLHCTSCHGGPLFSSAWALPADGAPEVRFENNGLYAAYPVGNRGLYELTGEPSDSGRFRPPSLRNVELTAPYMHDGSLTTLEAVIAHYEAGGARALEQSPLVQGFVLSAEERADLLAFLRSLTDHALLNDRRFADPWPSAAARVEDGGLPNSARF